MIEYDPIIANATPTSLIRIVDTKADASQLERALAKALQDALDELNDAHCGYLRT